MPGRIIYGVLSNDADVAALVGSRIYPIEAVQGASVPYVVYQTVVGIEDKVKGRDSVIKNYRMQIDGFAATKSQISDLMAKIDVALKNYTGSNYVLNVDEIEHESDNLSEITSKNLHRESRDYKLRIKL